MIDGSKNASLIMLVVRAFAMFIITILSIYIICSIRVSRNEAQVKSTRNKSYWKVFAEINDTFFVTNIINTLIVLLANGVIFDKANITSAVLVISCFFMITKIYCFGKKSTRDQLRVAVFGKSNTSSTKDSQSQNPKDRSTKISQETPGQVTQDNPISFITKTPIAVSTRNPSTISK